MVAGIQQIRVEVARLRGEPRDLGIQRMPPVGPVQCDVANGGQRGVIVYERVASSLYSGRMLKSFNLDGAVRVSPLHCHTGEEIERFLAITEAMARR